MISRATTCVHLPWELLSFGCRGRKVGRPHGLARRLSLNHGLIQIIIVNLPEAIFVIEIFVARSCSLAT